jgi:hypothetical protein
MYYWRKNVNNIILEEELVCMENINEVYIGTAYLSIEGLRMLNDIIKKNGIKKDNVHVFISDEFSQENPYELLTELCQISHVKIFFNRTFHSKVYLLKGSVNKLIFGSSNFTLGGFSKNIEFNNIEEINGEKLSEIDRFFRYCDFHSTEVTDDVIKYYKENQDEIEALKQVQEKLRKKIKGYINQDDAIDLENYNIEHYYFTLSDYETFFNRNAPRKDIEIMEKRKIVQDKMLSIHNNIYNRIKKLGINCHWNSNNITSLIKPCVYNKERVGWIGIRYGKSKKEVDLLNQGLSSKDKDEIKGFQKHGCLQFCIVPSGFEINLFLAVRNDAIDRAHVQEHIDKLAPKIISEISKLQGNGMTWEIYNDETKERYVFNIDSERTDDFCEFLKKYDRDGCESYLKLFFNPDDETLIDINSISENIIYYMTLLNPLYNTMVWRPKI